MFWFWYSLSPKDQKLWDCSTSNTFSPHQAKLWATELLGRWWRLLLLGSTRCRHARLLQSKCSKVGHGQPSQPMCPEDSISQWRAPPRVYRWWHTGLGLCKGVGGVSSWAEKLLWCGFPEEAEVLFGFQGWFISQKEKEMYWWSTIYHVAA